MGPARGHPPRGARDDSGGTEGAQLYWRPIPAGTHRGDPARFPGASALHQANQAQGVHDHHVPQLRGPVNASELPQLGGPLRTTGRAEEEVGGHEVTTTRNGMVVAFATAAARRRSSATRYGRTRACPRPPPGFCGAGRGWGRGLPGTGRGTGGRDGLRSNAGVSTLVLVISPPWLVADPGAVGAVAGTCCLERPSLTESGKPIPRGYLRGG